MAIVVKGSVTAADTTLTASSVVSAALSVTTGDLLVVMCGADNAGDAVTVPVLTLTNSGTAQTWTSILASPVPNGTTPQVRAWYSIATQTASITATIAKNTSTDLWFKFANFSGYNTTTPCPVGSATGINTTGATNYTRTITPATTGSLLYMLMHDNNSATGLTPQTGTTTDFSYAPSGLSNGILVKPTTQPSGTSAVTMSVNALNNTDAIGLGGFEIAIAAAATAVIRRPSKRRF